MELVQMEGAVECATGVGSEAGGTVIVWVATGSLVECVGGEGDALEGASKSLEWAVLLSDSGDGE